MEGRNGGRTRLPHLLKLLLLLAVANGAPVLAKKAWGRTQAQPLDAGLLFLDRRPVFGPTKTVRGVSGFDCGDGRNLPPLSGLPGGSAR